MKNLISHLNLLLFFILKHKKKILKLTLLEAQKI